MNHRREKSCPFLAWAAFHLFKLYRFRFYILVKFELFPTY